MTLRAQSDIVATSRPLHDEKDWPTSVMMNRYSTTAAHVMWNDPHDPQFELLIA